MPNKGHVLHNKSHQLTNKKYKFFVFVFIFCTLSRAIDKQTNRQVGRKDRSDRRGRCDTKEIIGEDDVTEEK